MENILELTSTHHYALNTITNAYNFKAHKYEALQFIYECIDISSQVIFEDGDLDNLNISNNALGKGDKIYFLPGVTVPRFKVRELGKNLEFDIVRNMDKATKIIINMEAFINEISQSVTYYHETISTDGLIKLLDAIENDPDYSNIPEIKTFVDNVKAKIVEINCTRVLLPYRVRDLFNKFVELYSMPDDTLEVQQYANRLRILKSDVYNNLVQNIKNTAIQFIDEKTLIKQCNGSKTIDHEAYTRLDQMFSNYQNADVALELLCNYNFEESMFYILLLASRHSFNDISSSKHVSYKNLRNYCKKEWHVDISYFYRNNIMHVIRPCFNRGTMSKEILGLFKNDILNFIKNYGENDMFTITAISLKDELKEKLV